VCSLSFGEREPTLFVAPSQLTLHGPTGWEPLVIFGIDIVSMLLGGLAAGMVLFIVSVGLSVTMGLMGFVNLAHGGFAMLGGYVIVLTMRNWGIGFVPALALGFVVIAGCSIPGSIARPSSIRCCSPSGSSS